MDEVRAKWLSVVKKDKESPLGAILTQSNIDNWGL